MSKKAKLIMGILGIISIGIVSICGLFRRELATLRTINKISDYPFYEMEYKADYALEEFLKKGAATDEELVEFITSKMLKGFKVNAKPNGACSTFKATTKEGDYLFARNFDYKASSGMIVKSQPKEGYRSISLVNLAHIGYINGKLPEGNMVNQISTLATPYVVLDGMNECGLAVGVLVVRDQITNQETNKVPITTTAALRMLLDKAANVEEAIKLLQQYDMHSSGGVGYHFQIADAVGDSVVVEYVDNEMKLIRPDENGYLAATNFLLYETRNDGVGQDRYQTIMDHLVETDAILSEEEAMVVLEQASSDNKEITYYDGQTIISNTQWSAVYNLSKRTVKICIGHDYSKVYEYNL